MSRTPEPRDWEHFRCLEGKPRGTCRAGWPGAEASDRGRRAADRRGSSELRHALRPESTNLPGLLPSDTFGARDADASSDMDFLLGRAVSSPEGGAPYLVTFSSVREGLLRLLEQREQPVDARLVALVELSDRVSEYVDETSTIVNTEQLKVDLQQALGGAQRATTSWTDRMAARVARFYLEEYERAGSTRLGHLLERVRRVYGRRTPELGKRVLTDGEALAACGRLSWDVEAYQRGTPFDSFGWDEEAVLRTYRSRRAQLLLSHGRRIEGYLTNYCLNHLLVEHYVDWPSLRAYAQELALRIASLRFLLFSHPDVAVAWEGGPEGPDSREMEGEVWSGQALDRAAEETVQSVNRACEQGSFLAALRRSTRLDDAPGATGMAGLVTV